MAIVTMRRLELYGLLEDREQFLQELQKLGTVEIAQEAESAPESAGLISSLADMDRELADIGRIFSLFDKFSPQKPGFIEQFSGIRTVLTPDERKSLLSRRNELALLKEELFAGEAEYAKLEHEIAKIEREIYEAEPWLELPVPVDKLHKAKYFQVYLGAVDDKQDLSSFLEAQGIPYIIEQYGRRDKRTYMAVYLPRTEAASRAMKEADFSDCLPPNKTGIVKEFYLNRKEQLQEIQKKLAALRQSLQDLAQKRPLVQAFYDQIYNDRLRTEAALRAEAGKKVFMLKGWVEEPQAESVRKALQNLNLPHVLEIKPPQEDEQPPVALKNPRFLTPFEALIESFSYPQTHEVDPTSVVAPFFTLFFGISLGDAGYGLVLSLFCFLLLRKMALKPSGKKLSWLFLFSGLGAVLVGALTASYFGFSPYKGIINPLEQPTILLAIVLGLGLIHLYTGTIISAFMAIRDGRWDDAVWNQGSWLLFLTSLLLVIGKGMLGLEKYGMYINYGALTSAALVVLANTRGKKGVAAKLLAVPGGLYTIYNSIGFFSDVLSYSRLMALGLSGGVMASIINLFAKMTWQIPVIGWLFAMIIFVFGHTLNLALGILGGYVHSSRLQFLEFFGKFFEGGGRIFAPLRWENKYIFLNENKEV